MFVHMIRGDLAPNDYTSALFEGFKQIPGLLHAYLLQPEDNPNETALVAVWESREAAEDYFSKSPLRAKVDTTVPNVRRRLFRVIDSM